MKKLILFFLVFFSLIGFANAQCTVILNFDTINGSGPLGSLISDGTFLYGMTKEGGRYNQVPMSTIGNGIIFKIKPDGSDFEKLLDFAQDTDTIIFTLDTNGSSPCGSLIFDGTFMYGMTTHGGGPHQNGTIFKIKPDGSDYLKLYNFDNPTGVIPDGDLISDGSFLYGMTAYGGAQNAGVIFKVNLDGSNYVKLWDFDITNGNTPVGSLIYDGTFLYGVATGGGANYYGSIFKIKTDGSDFTNLLDLNYPIGFQPSGSLISDGTFLYGMTTFGGTSTDCNDGCGTIFKIKPDGSNYVTILNFDSLKGENPFGSLMSDGTYLYGMTNGNGFHKYGTVFKVKPDGSGFEKLLNFDSINGRWPLFGSLISDGNFLYGMTSRGGTYDKGVIFKLPYHCSAQFTLVPDTSTPHHYYILNNAAGAPPLSYNWNWGDGTYDTIAYPSHTYSAAGNYTICLTVTDSSGCSSTYCYSDSLQKSTNSIIYVNVIPPGTLGINEINKSSSFSVYPNPADNNIIIENNSLSKNAIISIYNLQGQLMLIKSLKQEKTEVEISSLAKGLYFIKAQTDNGFEIQKFIKQ